MLASSLLFLSSHVFSQDTEVQESTDTSTPRIIYYNLHDTIHGGTVEILTKIFDKARKENSEAILIQLDTPGGLLNATEDIVKMFLNSTVPVIVYVAPSGAKAGSAGTFITMAAHVAAMAPGTYIGAAHPVSMFGGDKEGEQQKIMKKKIESATSSFIEAIADQRGRNKEWAKKAVLESDSITQNKALKKNVIDLVATNKKELLKKINGRKIKLLESEKVLNTAGAILVPYEPGFKLRFLNAVASPTIMYLLILGIIAGIYLEISHPGSIIPGVAAGVCFILVLFATRTLPINAFGILLILIALALLVTEIYVTSYGLLTVAAIACFFFGSLFLFDPKETDVRVPMGYIIGSSAALAAIAIFIGYNVARTYKTKMSAGQESLAGIVGTVEEAISPDSPGKIFVHSEYWTATANEKIEKGEKVEIIKTKGLLAVVKIVKKNT